MKTNTIAPVSNQNFMRAILFCGLALALSACEDGEGLNLDFLQTEPKTETAAASTTAAPDGVIEQDVEAPDIFSVNENGLWDGRPSLGGTWVAHPDVKDPQRVVIRNADNGKSVVGALFRRERLNPGPKLQVSSDAAEALGMLAGQPAKLSVVALKKEKITPPPVVAPVDGVEDAEVAAATADIEAKPLDAVDVASSAIERAAPTPRPSSAAAPAVAPVAAAPAAAAPATTNSSLPNPFIQVGTFSEKGNADAASDQLRKAGIIPTVKSSSGEAGTLFRVLVGPASDIDERKALLTKVQGLGFEDVFFANNLPDIKGVQAVIRIASILLSFALTALPAAAFETIAKSAIVLDVNTNQTLMEKNADMALPPASMSKLMTLYMTFEALSDGRWTLDKRVPVSEFAASFGGSTMFLEPGDRPTVEELIRGVIVLSGNDSSVALGEAMAGTEAAFAQQMTLRAQELGMTSSTFVNASGWPAAGHRMSMRDLAILAKRLIQDFPQYYGYFAETEFQYEDSPPANRFNRNPLLKLNIGADGLKTGHTEEAGFGLVGSAQRSGRRIIFVFSGLDTSAQRAQEAEKMTNWAFNQFVERQLADDGVILTEADVWMGEVAKVGLAAKEDVKVLIPVIGARDVKTKINYVGPLEAPIEAGDEVARLVVTVPGFDDIVHPLVATETVPEGGFATRLRTAAMVLLGQLTGELMDRAETLF